MINTNDILTIEKAKKFLKIMDITLIPYGMLMMSKQSLIAMTMMRMRFSI